jgi:ferredoxin-NADP reductase
MASARRARVESARSFGPNARLLTLRIADGEPLGFSGGQYIIIDTEIVLEGGKRAKRAYSLLSPDDGQHEVQIAVQRVGAGAASNFLQDIGVGAEFSFSGPWGKWHAPEADAARPIVVATDTGITAALGLLRGARLRAGATRLVWMRDANTEFLPTSFVTERLPPSCDFVDAPVLHATSHPERGARAAHWFRERIAPPDPAFDRAFLVGDGNVLLPLRDLVAPPGGLPESSVHIECFFHNPARKAA